MPEIWSRAWKPKYAATVAMPTERTLCRYEDNVIGFGFRAGPYRYIPADFMGAGKRHLAARYSRKASVHGRIWMNLVLLRISKRGRRAIRAMALPLVGIILGLRPLRANTSLAQSSRLTDPVLVMW